VFCVTAHLGRALPGQPNHLRRVEAREGDCDAEVVGDERLDALCRRHLGDRLELDAAADGQQAGEEVVEADRLGTLVAAVAVLTRDEGALDVGSRELRLFASHRGRWEHLPGTRWARGHMNRSDHALPGVQVVAMDAVLLVATAERAAALMEAGAAACLLRPARAWLPM
jgi:hypothetical protein